MPTPPPRYTRLQPPLAAALYTLGQGVQRASARRRRNEEHAARPSTAAYTRSKEEVEAAKQLAARIVADHDLPEPPAPEPYKSPDDLLHERLARQVLTNTSEAEQLPLLPLPAQ